MDEIRNIVWNEYNSTVINPLSVLVLIIMIMFIFKAKRHNILIPILITACIIPPMQRIVIASIDFTILRILIMMGLLRIILNNEYKLLNKLNTIDKVLIAYMISNTIINTILWGTIGAFINRLGVAIDILGVYFLFRISLQKNNRFEIISKIIIIVSVIIAVFMVIEQLTGRNIFSAFGGIPFITVMREGRLRSQGSFSHPLMAGIYGALLLPLMWGTNKNYLKKYLLFIGTISGLLITITSSSSTPLIAVGTSILGMFLWRFRKNVRKIWIATILLLIGLHFAMKAPVWNLIARIDLVGGSTGYHRFLLINEAINRFSTWFLFGTRTTAYWGFGLQDVTNQYVLEGIEGGFLTLIFFIIIMILCFRKVGKFIKIKADNPGLIIQQKMVWSYGVLLLTHTVIFLAVSYFGQMITIFYLHIAMISSINLEEFNTEKNQKNILVNANVI